MSAPVLAARRHRRWKGAGERNTEGVGEQLDQRSLEGLYADEALGGHGAAEVSLE